MYNDLLDVFVSSPAGINATCVCLVVEMEWALGVRQGFRSLVQPALSSAAQSPQGGVGCLKFLNIGRDRLARCPVTLVTNRT